MDMDARQTRNLFLAGTVPFPTPFPSTGTISLDVGQLTYSPGQAAKAKNLVLVQEFCGNQTVVRLMLQTDVSAIFVPGIRDANGVFRISHESQVGNLENGEWFLDEDVDAATLRARLGLQQQDDISTRNSILRGIVFIAEDRPILHITEVSYTAGADEELLESSCCTCHRFNKFFQTARGGEDLSSFCTPCLQKDELEEQ